MDAIDLGPCCGCKTTEGVRNIALLQHRCAVEDHGWGCFTCDLPPQGASIVLCDPCLDRYGEDTRQVPEACRGYPSEDGREPMAQTLLRRKHEHNPARHREGMDG